VLKFDSSVISSITQLEQLVKAFSFFKSKGKRIVSYIENSFSELDYLAAASGTVVVLPPGSMVYLTGVGGEFLFLKKLFDQQGIEVDYARSSEYKSATGSLRRSISKNRSRLA
jgi:hypothetical protein